MGGLKLDEDATRALDVARALARRYQHETVEPEHLLAALFEQDPNLVIDGIARGRLLALVDARLASRPSHGLYRDAVRSMEPTLSPAVSMALRRASAAPDTDYLAVTPHKLLAALFHEPSLVPLFAESGFDTVHLDEVLAQATELARARGHELVTAHHVLAVVQDAEWFVHAMSAASADHARLRAALETGLAAHKRAGIDRRPVLSEEVTTIRKRAKNVAEATDQDTLRGEDLVRHLLQEPHRSGVFAQAGVPELALLRYFTSGHVDAGEDAVGSDASALEVVFHDDDVTTMELVVAILEECFDCAPEDARELMLAVHTRGERSIGSFVPSDARVRVAQARVMAAEASMPLRISLRSAQ